MFLYTNEHGTFFNYLVAGSVDDVGLIIEVPLNNPDKIKMSTWDVQYAHFDNGTNPDGSPKGIEIIDYIPHVIKKKEYIDFVFNMEGSSLWK